MRNRSGVESSLGNFFGVWIFSPPGVSSARANRRRPRRKVSGFGREPVMRWMTGVWIIAAIDSLIVVGFVVLGTFVYRTHRVRAASLAIATL